MLQKSKANMEVKNSSHTHYHITTIFHSISPHSPQWMSGSSHYCVTRVLPLFTMIVWSEKPHGRIKATLFQIWLFVLSCCISDLVFLCRCVSFQIWLQISSKKVMEMRFRSGSFATVLCFRSQARRGWWKWVSDLVLTKDIVKLFSHHYYYFK